ncbi:MAG: hypothetical protein KGL12_05920 [Rhodospirillales bacterium]|nr:hypothetical protein [Rhodospirillales bacterium]
MTTHPNACTCCADMLPPGFDRRGFLRLAGLGAAGLALAPRRARAEPPPYKALLLSCVDPRTQAPVADWMNQPAAASHRGSLQGQYSQFTIAGAAVGVIAPAFPKAWSETFWENFSASVQLHRIENLIVVDHANCGALRLAYGEDVYKNPKLELEAHRADVAALQRELSIRHPDAGFQAWFLGRDGAGRFTAWQNLIAGPVIG